MIHPNFEILTCNSATALGTCARPPFALRTGAQRIDGIGDVSAALVSKHRILYSAFAYYVRTRILASK